MTSLSDFTYGYAPQPIIHGLKATVITQNDLSHNLQRLKADGYTHYEINPECYSREIAATTLRAAALYCKQDRIRLLAIADELQAQ